MIREQFFSDPDNGYAKVGNKLEFDRIWKRVLSFEEGTGLCLDDPLTREQYISLFNSMKIRRSLRFRNCKVVVLAYVRYLVANGVLPPEQEGVVSSILPEELTIVTEGNGVQYYRDLDMLQEAIRRTVAASENYDETLHDSPIAMLYLAWYGLAEQEIVDYRKADVLSDGILVRGEKRPVPERVLQVFTRLRYADGYYQQARGLIFHKYTASEYLFRTERNSHITVGLMRSFISRFNNIAKKIYSLSYQVVYQSGIFQRVYRMECDGFELDLNDAAVASRVFCEDLSSGVRRLGRIRDYNLYKQLYVSSPAPLPLLENAILPQND